MNRLISHLALACACAAAAPFASATVLTFDDLASDDFVGANYGGLDWSASDWFAFGGEQAPFTAHSGSMRVASGFGDADAATARSAWATGKTFQGAWFAGYEDVERHLQALRARRARGDVVDAGHLRHAGLARQRLRGPGGRGDRLQRRPGRAGSWTT